MAVTSFPSLPWSEILSLEPGPGAVLLERGARSIGTSREGREIVAIRVGRGPLCVSLIGGCHADEPVGPETLTRLATFLLSLDADSPFLTEATWSLVPHVNPDGRARNRSWSERRREVVDSRGSAGTAFDLADYLAGSIRESPGDDIEFGFPETDELVEVRPENRAVADFLGEGAPFDLHASFHGMGLAAGVWFLLEPAWIDRTIQLRENLRRQVAAMGYPLLDVDRRGEKGFTRIEEGFSTRPDSSAMRAFFLGRGEPQTAALFRPNSMEYVRSLGGDPLTIVTEMPLFLLPAKEAAADVRRRLARALGKDDRAGLERLAADLGIRAMPIRDQARLQLAFFEQALAAVSR